MATEMNSREYWLTRFIGAVEKGNLASGERSRVAYQELARHYWSMHVMINGRSPLQDVDALSLISDMVRPVQQAVSTLPAARRAA